MNENLKDIYWKKNGVVIDIPLSEYNDKLARGQEVLRGLVFESMIPYMPMQSGLFIDMTRQRNAQLKGKKMVCIGYGPQARYLYEGVKMVNSKTGNGPALIHDKAGNVVGLRYPLGSTLVATDIPLNFSNTPHPKAQAHWDEPAIAENYNKWVKEIQDFIGGE